MGKEWCTGGDAIRGCELRLYRFSTLESPGRTPKLTRSLLIPGCEKSPKGVT